MENNIISKIKISDITYNLKDLNATSEIEEIKTQVANKVDKNLGIENANKILAIDEEGNVIAKEVNLNGDGESGNIDLSAYATKDYVYDFTERLSGNGLTAISNLDQVIINVGAGDGINVTEDTVNVKLQDYSAGSTSATKASTVSSVLRPIQLDKEGNLAVAINEKPSAARGATMALGGYLWSDRTKDPDQTLLYSDIYVGNKTGTSKGWLLHNAQIAPDAREYCFIEPTWTVLTADTTQLDGTATLTGLTDYYDGLTVSFYIGSDWQEKEKYTLTLNSLRTISIDDISQIATPGAILSLTYYQGVWRKPSVSISGEKIVHALTLNGISYDGSQPVEINLNAPNITQSTDNPSGTATIGDIWVVQENSKPDELYMYGGSYIKSGETTETPVWLQISPSDLSNYITTEKMHNQINVSTNSIYTNILGQSIADYNKKYGTGNSINERVDALEKITVDGAITDVIGGKGVSTTRTNSEITVNLSTYPDHFIFSENRLKINYKDAMPLYDQNVICSSNNPVADKSYYITTTYDGHPAVCVPWHDTEVQQDLSSTNEERSILLKGDSGTTSYLGSTSFGSDVTINPYTNTISAKGFQVLDKGDTTAAIKMESVVGEPTLSLYTDINNSPTFSIGAYGTISGSTTVKNNLRNFMNIYVQNEEPDAPIGAIWIDTSVSSITYAEPVEF